MRLFSPDRMMKVMDRLGVKEDEVITHPMVTRAIEKAQIRVEAHNFDIRKHLLDYDDVVNKQREVVYTQRREILLDEDIHGVMDDFVRSGIDHLLAEHTDPEQPPDYWRMDELARRFQALVLAPLPVAKDEHLDLGHDVLGERLHEAAREARARKVERLGAPLSQQLERFVLLRVLDEKWRDHLNELIMLRSGIGLRSYGQRDPLLEYKKESFRLFEDLMDSIQHDAVQLYFRAELAVAPPPPPVLSPERMQAQHGEVSAYDHAAGPDDEHAVTSVAHRQQAAATAGRPQPVRREVPKVGRNEPCPCGSGKKYKQCHGAGE